MGNKVSKPPLGEVIPLHQANAEDDFCKHCDMHQSEWQKHRTCFGQHASDLDKRIAQWLCIAYFRGLMALPGELTTLQSDVIDRRVKHQWAHWIPSAQAAQNIASTEVTSKK